MRSAIHRGKALKPGMPPRPPQLKTIPTQIITLRNYYYKNCTSTMYIVIHEYLHLPLGYKLITLIVLAIFTSPIIFFRKIFENDIFSLT